MKSIINFVERFTAVRCLTIGLLVGMLVGYAAARNEYLNVSLWWSGVGFVSGIFIGYIVKAEVKRHRDDS